ncbi:MAG TPA: hypothetical protein VK846_17695 [Candidatus Limnocylindria bacterium]|nr:hypothetical protein [Candidatus Limnocylindria bacterium]
MISEQRSVQLEMKTTRQLLVRFSHAPCVKLTLQPGAGGMAAPQAFRILRLRKS